jgi:hypothetical protein
MEVNTYKSRAVLHDPQRLEVRMRQIVTEQPVEMLRCVVQSDHVTKNWILESLRLSNYIKYVTKL